MRGLLMIGLFLAFSIMYSCSSLSSVEARVVRDCSGTYIRVGEKDYQVCNRNLLNSYHDGDSVRIRFSPVESCPELDSVMICLMFHQNEGFIQIKKVNEL